MKTKLSIIFMILMINKFVFNHQTKGIICKMCEDLQKSIFNFYSDYKSKIYSFTDFLCKIEATSDLCNYFVLKDGKYLMENEKNFIEATNYICSNVFSVCDKIYQNYNFEKFRNDLYKNFPIPEKKIKKIYGKKSFSTLTINDVHLQKDYLYKGRVNCKDPSGCCYQKMGDKEEGQKAGYWGTPNSKCDTPKYFWERTLNNLKKEELKTDFILLLGDNYGHNYYRDKGNEDLYKWNEYFYDSVLENFPNSTIIPVLGNHEADPVNYFDFDDKNNSVIKNIFPNFKKFLDQKKIDEYINNGFYDLEFNDFGVKFIVLNTQMTDIENFFLVKKHTDLLNFFEKLTQSLYESEQKDQKVILLSHINFGNDGIYDGYEKNMYALIERFKETITTSLAGHTHQDEFKFIKNRKDEVIHVNFISPSITTFDNYNPSFRIYKFLNRKIEDYDQYRFNIDFHNKKAEDKIFEFQFQKAYSFKNEYKLKKWEDFEDYHNFNKLLEEDKETQKIYIKNKFSMNKYVEWERESFKLKCEIMGVRLDQKKCFDTINGGPSFFDYFLNPLFLFRTLFIRPWLIPVE